MIIQYIRETLGIDVFSEDDIDTVLGIFLVNDFEINAQIDEDEWSSTGGNDSIRGLYQIASIPNHDCRANTNHVFASLEDGFRMTVKGRVQKNWKFPLPWGGSTKVIFHFHFHFILDTYQGVLRP